MTIRSWHQDSEDSCPGVRRLLGAFVPNGTNSPTTKFGVGFTVARTAVGIWLLTFDEPWAFWFPVTTPAWQVESGLAHDGVLTWGAVSRANKTAEIINRVAGAKADVAASGTLRIIGFEAVTARNNIPGINGVTT